MRLAIFALLITLPCLANGEYEDPTGKVYSSLADYTVNRDAVMKKCAFLAVGEVHRVSDAGPKISQHFWTKYSDNSRGIEYRANCCWPHDDRKWLQVWHEIVKTPGTMTGRSHYWNQPNKKYEKRNVGEKHFDFMQRTTGAFTIVDPFENLFRANALIDIFQERNCLETYFLQNGELKSAVLIGGMLQTEWLLWDDRKLKMKQSQAHGFMPIEVVSSTSDQDETTHIKWEKKDKLWVPTHIRSSKSLKDTNIVASVFSKFDWKVGKEVKPINPKWVNIYPLFVEQFGLEVDRDVEGQYVRGTEFVAPPDLFDDEDKKK
jgi:hypothetical protein